MKIVTISKMEEKHEAVLIDFQNVGFMPFVTHYFSFYIYQLLNAN